MKHFYGWLFLMLVGTALIYALMSFIAWDFAWVFDATPMVRAIAAALWVYLFVALAKNAIRASDE